MRARRARGDLCRAAVRLNLMLAAGSGPQPGKLICPRCA